MAENNFLKNLSAGEADLNLKIFNLVIGRVFKRAYLDMNETDKEKLEKVFLSGNDKEKDKFIKKYIPNFKKLFKIEAKKIEGEIKSEIEKQF